MIRYLAPLFIALGLAACGGSNSSAPPVNVVPPPPPPPPASFGTGPAACLSGKADGYDCAAVDLEKQLTLADLGGGFGNDIWGWTDMNGNEYALMGLTNGTVFVNISDPKNPIIVGNLPTQTVASTWRDIKVFGDHAYIVADNAGAHGMQIFSLARLRNSTTNQTFTADALYSQFANAHNIAINEDAAFAYAVGTNTCDEGLHMINISDPLVPRFAGCHEGGDTHDTQCVNYQGPDTDYTGREICFSSNSDTVGIADVTDKSTPVQVKQFTYPNLSFVHQAWLDETHTYLIVNDETDEIDRGQNTSTIVVDVSDLDNPRYLYTHAGTTGATDHNLYIVGNKIFQANYHAGLQILEYSDLATDTLVETASFDTFPADDSSGFDGAWSVYPFFASGTIIVSDTERGLFVFRPQ
ncbi:MAG: choice-of-anchor B family protein [Acidimicrobiales bacterium]|nr:MAG: choice-of-anchor B family protein [Acidimicrobiales bacterium]